MADQFGTDISNDALAKYVAGKIKSSPERFIFDRENDPRITNRELYETERLPRGSYSDFFVPDPLIEAFLSSMAINSILIPSRPVSGHRRD